MTITLWIPAAEAPRWPCVQSWWNLDTPNGEKLRMIRSGPNNVRFSWNKAVLDFLTGPDEWLFSVHNDVVLSPGTLTRLLSWNKSLISALIFMRQSPVIPQIWQAYQDDGHDGHYIQRINDTRNWFYEHKEWIRFGPYTIDPCPDNALVEIDFTSTSCTLIHRSVLEAMRPIVKDIWFEWDDNYNGGGEDRRFFENALKAGFRAYVDRSNVVGHLVGDIPTSAADFIAWDSVSQFNGTGERANA
jgi:GT2 family glycosyltransferase